MSSRTLSPRGFTLIEVMISVLILALGLLGLGAVIPVIVSQQRRAADSTLGVSCLNGAFATLAGRSQYLHGTEHSVWRHLLFNGQWSPNGEWETGERRQYSTVAWPWSGPDAHLYEYRAVASGEFEVMDDSGDTVLETTVQVQRRTIGPPAGSWQNFGNTETVSDLLRTVDRLSPTRDSAGAAVRPNLVWDFAARRAGDREIMVALFARRVDSGIRIPSGGNLYSMFASGQALAVGVNAATGVPTLNGTGDYAEPITLDAEYTGRSYLRTRIEATSGSPNEREMVSRTGQRLVDEFGMVYIVTGYDDTYDEIILDRPVNWPQNQPVRLVFVPQEPVHVSVYRVSVPY